MFEDWQLALEVEARATDTRFISHFCLNFSTIFLALIRHTTSSCIVSWVEEQVEGGFLRNWTRY